MVREADFESLNLFSGSKKDTERVDNFCPLEENTEYATIPYINVSPFPFFFFCDQNLLAKAFLTSLETIPYKIG